MFRYSCALFCAFLALSILEPAIARKSGFGGGRHSYPKSGGLSGGGHHYPSSTGLSGGSHNYPSSSGSHGYPSSGGLSGNSHGSGYPSNTHHTGSHGYPASGGLSGNSHGSNYPSNTNHAYSPGKGFSGNTHSTGGQSTTNVHYHYHYSPPQQIRYTPVHGGGPVNYPVYRGTPPTYVYQYKDSGSKYGTLLAGLALLNLGTLAGSAYAHSQSHSNYKPQPGEVCKFGVKKDNGDYEETKIDCQLITSFIFEEQAKSQSGSTQNGANNSVVTTTVTNVTTVNTTNMTSEQPAASTPAPVNSTPLYQMLSNGTLVPVNVSSANETVNTTGGSPNNTMTSSVTVTTTTTNTTTVTNALDVKGKPIEVTPGMQCYVIRNSRSSNMKRSVPCGLLQTYADKSLRRNSAVRNVPAFTVIAVIFTAFVVY